MPTSGLLVTAEHPDQVPQLLAALAAEPAISLAPPVDLHLPLVVDTPDRASDQRIWNWLVSLPGVAKVDVALIAWQPEPSDRIEPLEIPCERR